MREKTFAEVRRNAPAIVAARDGEEITLTPQKMDAQYDAQPYSRNFLEGTGSRRRPFTYRSAAPVSGHYFVVDLWLKFHKRKRPVFIEVNDFVLRVERMGVRAKNGKFTRLAE